MNLASSFENKRANGNLLLANEDDYQNRNIAKMRHLWSNRRLSVGPMLLLSTPATPTLRPGARLGSRGGEAGGRKLEGGQKTGGRKCPDLVRARADLLRRRVASRVGSLSALEQAHWIRAPGDAMSTEFRCSTAAARNTRPRPRTPVGWS